MDIPIEYGRFRFQCSQKNQCNDSSHAPQYEVQWQSRSPRRYPPRMTSLQQLSTGQWIGLRNKLQENHYPMEKSMVSGFDFPVNQSIELGLQSNRSATCQVRES